MPLTNYSPDQPTGPLDMLILAGSGPEPVFDPVTRDFLMESYFGLKRSCEQGSLLDWVSLGRNVPWLYRLTFRTQGFVRTADGEVETTVCHVVALRFLDDYLRRADRFEMLRLMLPANAFHPNISSGASGLGGAICVEVYPGEPLVDLCLSLHAILSWRLRSYGDALNPVASAWGRQNVDRPIDDRPLFGSRLTLQWQPSKGE